MFSKLAFTYLLLMVILIDLAEARFTEVPPPPSRPQHFRSKEELKKYLQKVHEYHLIVGRWRLRRNNEHPVLSARNNDVFKIFKINNDHYISKKELTPQLKFKKED